MSKAKPLFCNNGEILKICTKNNPDGLMVASVGRTEEGDFIDYQRRAGVLCDGRTFTISSSCDHKGWHHSISIDGDESDRLINPKDTYGRPKR